MPDQTPAQDEFDRFIAKNTGSAGAEKLHPDDRDSASLDLSNLSDDIDEEDRYREAQLDAAMRMPALGAPEGGNIKLPPASFDSGRATGVKGVIADARSYEMARQAKWMRRGREPGRGAQGSGRRGHVGAMRHSTASGNDLDGHGQDSDPDDNPDGDSDEEFFLQQWRDSRRRELEDEARKGVVSNRRTSPSLRTFGRLDKVDALGYLDAIERVGRETVVVVLVYDDECQVSAAVEAALLPSVAAHPTIHFVKVHYEDLEFDNAAVPAILAYRNQGDLFANLTGVVELIPDNEDFDSESLSRLFQMHGIV